VFSSMAADAILLIMDVVLSRYCNICQSVSMYKKQCLAHMGHLHH